MEEEEVLLEQAHPDTWRQPAYQSKNRLTAQHLKILKQRRLESQSA